MSDLPREIVGDIDEDAERIILGMLVLGKCVAWMDDVSLEVVDKTVNVTGGESVEWPAVRRSRF